MVSGQEQGLAQAAPGENPGCASSSLWSREVIFPLCPACFSSVKWVRWDSYPINIFLSTHCVPGSVLGSGDTAGDETKTPAFIKLMGQTDNKQGKQVNYMGS